MSEQNPWRTLKTKVVYQNPWIRVREDDVTRPDGSPGIYGVVETKIACGVIALTPENEVYLIGQYRYPTCCYSWEIVEGGAEHGEDPLLAIQRELQEEAGLVANRWDQLGPGVHLSNCISNELALFYLARELKQTKRSPEVTEVLTVRKAPLEEAFAMVHDGTIVDAMSIIALTRFEQLLRTGKVP